MHEWDEGEEGTEYMTCQAASLLLPYDSIRIRILFSLWSGLEDCRAQLLFATEQSSQ
jgi:hypothetical protein